MTDYQQEEFNSKKLICFRLDQTYYAIDMGKIKEVIQPPEIRELPGVSFYVKGVMNLRGEIIPIVDLRKLMNIPAKDGGEVRVIVYDVNGVDIGFFVDEIARVITISLKKILPPPPILLKGLDPGTIGGVFELEDKNVLLFNLEKMLSPKETANLRQATKQ
ncbi:MAG: chemotaxis protein CheW [SAR324 cluster bacterium]|nr:chemotaxis protein CheW [SAR324 cluster bacterium]